jgi:tetratricopeptide (TPR) repeat protein
MSDRARDAALGAALFAVTCAAYAGLWNADFVGFDDPDYVSGNPIVQQGLSWAGLRWALATTHAGNWFPLTWASHMLDVTLFGVDPRGHHAVSVLLHATSSALLFAVLRGATGDPLRAAFAAALFAWHPLRVESVAWIAERKDVLSVLLALLAVAAWSRHARGGSRIWGAAALACFALGLAAKPMLVTLPLLLVAFEVWPLRRTAPTVRANATSLVAKWPFLVLAAASSAITLAVQRAATTSLEALPLAARAANALLSIGTYLRQLVWPVDLSVLYAYPTELPILRVAGAGALVAAGIGAAVALRRERPWLVAGVAWFGIALVPVLGLVQVGEQAHADRYTYLPSVGLCWIAAWLWPSRWLGSPGARALAAAAALGVASLLVVATARQVRVWSDGVALFEHAAAVEPHNASARLHLGNALAAAGELEAAAAAYREALRLRPDAAEPTHHLGVVLARLGRTREAAAQFESAARLDPDWADPHHSLGVLAAQRGDFAAARTHLGAARERRPDSAPIRMHYGLALRQLGERAAALAELREAVRLDPFSAEAQRALDAAERDAAVRGDR